MSQFDRSELVSLAKWFYEKDCYDDAISYMKEVINMATPLNYEERRIIFVGYINLIRPYVNLYVSPESSSLPDEKLRREINLKAQSETNRLFDDAIQLLNSYWVKRDTNIEAVAHYKCFLAGQYDNKASVASDADKELNISKALSLFEEAYEIANKNLNPAHPVSIDVAGYYSEFNFRLLDCVDRALKIATEAHDKALSKLSKLPEELKDCATKKLECLSAEINEWKN